VAVVACGRIVSTVCAVPMSPSATSAHRARLHSDQRACAMTNERGVCAITFKWIVCSPGSPASQAQLAIWERKQGMPATRDGEPTKSY